MNKQTDTDNNPAKQPTRSIIGESIIIVGNVSGQEDIMVDGLVEGEMNFRECNIFVGETGRVNASVTAKKISVEGDVKGELRASEQVNIKPSGRVTGDIKSPQVVLDAGCQFKGSVDMEELHATGDNRNAKLQLASNKKLSPEHSLKTRKQSGNIQYNTPSPMKKGDS